jgi:hypothetical protein
MPEITPTKSDDNKIIVWSNITNGDTAAPILIASGTHQVVLRGTHAAEVVDIHHGLATDDMDAIDTDAAPNGLRFSAVDATANVTLAGGYVKPVFSTAGSGAEDITVTITKID